MGKFIPTPQHEVFKVEGSSQIVTAFYKEEIQELVIEFVNKSFYKYTPVSSKQFEKLKSAPSAGGYFHKYIKNNSKIKTTRP
jgi:hypothetical protein